jgi:YHS domain-containing protein
MKPKEKKCPVCGWNIITEEARTLKISGKTIEVCCDDCAEKVKSNSQKYSEANNDAG